MTIPFNTRKVFSKDGDWEKRKYIRIDGVFPVEFTIVRLQGDLPGIDWRHGQTSNVGEGGLCLETSEINDSIVEFLHRESVMLELKIPVPPTKPPIRAVGEIAWVKKIERAGPPLFYIGLKFRSISSVELDRLLWHARLFQVSAVWVFWTAVVIFLSTILLNVLYNDKKSDMGLKIDVFQNTTTQEISFEEKTSE